MYLKFAAQLHLSRTMFAVGLGLMLVVGLQTDQVAAQCTGIECQEECECTENESPPCNIAGLIVANVIVATPLLLVYLFVPAACCIYSCRREELDKPPKIGPAPPTFNEVYRRHTVEENLEYDETDDDDSQTKDCVFEPGDKEHKYNKDNVVNVQFHVADDKATCYSNEALLDLDELQTKN